MQAGHDESPGAGLIDDAALWGTERIASGDQPREVSTMITRLAVDYVREQHGEPGVAEMGRLLGDSLSLEALVDDHRWCSHPAMTAVFDAAAAVTGDPSVAFRTGASATRSRAAAGVKLLLRAVGSPRRVFRLTGAIPRIFPVATLTPIDVRRGTAAFEFTVDPRLAVSRHDCALVRGILSVTPCLFGLPAGSVSEAACRTDGAEVCRFDATWQPSSWWDRLSGRTRRRSAAIGEEQTLGQLQALHATLEELARADGVDAMLSIITERAAVAVRATGFVLAVRIDGETNPRVHADGLAPQHVREAGRALLRGDPMPHASLVVDVRSSVRDYGRLAALGPAMLPGEDELLTSYARLAAVALDAATALDMAERRQQATAALLELATTLAHADHHSVATALAGAVPDVVEADAGMVALRDRESGRLAATASSGWPIDTDEISLDIADPPIRDALDAPRPCLHHPGEGPIGALAGEWDVGAVASVRIVVDGQPRGLVFAAWKTAPPERLEATVLLRLGGIADQAATALSRAELIARIDHQASHDTLTNLPNRRVLEDRIAAARARWQRTGEPFALLFIDLDGFKAVNDNFGHAAGDAVLVEVADRLRAAVRRSDSVARLGGDEFVVLLADAGTSAAVETATARILEALESPLMLEDPAVSVGASVGVALAPRDGTTAEDLLRHADASMYQAKAGRRNADAPSHLAGG